ncbi:hypothetical protein BH23CHL1_BH23CHL1_03140 [soil metagenome]
MSVKIERETRLRLASGVKRRGGELMNQQMWCWGADIRRAEGNLLAQYGFTKYAAPDSSGTKPCYGLSLPTGTTIGLWGFGMYYGDHSHGGLFLKRFDFAPRMVAPDEMHFNAWTAGDLPAMQPPGTNAQCHQARQLLSLALEWIASYEAWVVQTAGAAYRQATVDAWQTLHKSVAVDAHEMAGAWSLLARQCAGAATTMAAVR